MIYICTPKQVCKKFEKWETFFIYFFIVVENVFRKESSVWGR